MGDQRTIWHEGFAAYVADHRPDGVEVMAEVVLSQQQGTDLVLLRKLTLVEPIAAGGLNALWRILPKLMLIEYKSRARLPEPGVLHQLLGYGHILARSRLDELDTLEDLALVLAAPSVTPTVKKEAKRLQCTIAPIEAGLYRFEGLDIPTYMLALNEMGEAAQKPLLGFFGSKGLRFLDDESRGWLWRHYVMGTQENLEDLPDYEQLAEELAQSNLGKAIFEARLEAASTNEVIARLLQRGEGLSALSPELKAELLERLQANDEPSS